MDSGHDVDQLRPLPEARCTSVGAATVREMKARGPGAHRNSQGARHRPGERLSGAGRPATDGARRSGLEHLTKRLNR
jgi:hypothetical protein